MRRTRKASATSPSGPRGLPRGRRHLFIMVTLAVPVLFFLLLELTLRVAGYGPDLSLFTTEVMAGRTYTVMNPEVKSRYFARVPFSPSTSPDYFSVPKPAGTFRIFCLGGSTTVGYPYWYNGSFSSFLRDRLRRLFPDRRIEVINMGMTATNSFTVNDMARELVDYEPDLFIVYDGHNEFYGALGVASNESIARARWFTTLYLRAIHFRTFLLLRNLIAGASSLFRENTVQETGATMMERLASGQLVPYGSPLYNAGLQAYRANLEELKDLASERRIPVILGSQVSNLRDLPPFVSERQRAMAADPADRFDSLLASGHSLLKAGRFETAAIAFRNALLLDSLHAGAHYALGRLLDTSGAPGLAEREYMKSRDYDLLRFRASTDMNNIIRDVARNSAFTMADMEAVFRRNSPRGLIGSSLIVEHLHPNSRGFFLMAAEYARTMRTMGLMVSTGEWAARDTIAEESFWEGRCLTELDEMMARRRTEILVSGWPFRPGVPLVDAVPADDTLGTIVERVTRGEWNWLQAHTAAAEFYLTRGDPGRAEREYLAITNQLPLYDVSPWLTMARIQIAGTRLDDARVSFLGSLRVKPTILAYRALGDISLRSDRPSDAAAWYEKTFSFPQSPPERVENGYLLALALARSGNKTRSSEELLKVLTLKPDHQPSAELLSRLRSGNVR